MRILLVDLRLTIVVRHIVLGEGTPVVASEDGGASSGLDVVENTNIFFLPGNESRSPNYYSDTSYKLS